MMAVLLLAAEDPALSMTWAKRAQDLAEQLNDPQSRISALQMVAWVEFFSGGRDGLDKLAQVIELAREESREDLVALTYVIIVRTAGRLRQYEISARYVRAGVDYCSTRISTSGGITCSAGSPTSCSPKDGGPRRPRPR
jgi:hypothetical protein